MKIYHKCSLNSDVFHEVEFKLKDIKVVPGIRKEVVPGTRRGVGKFGTPNYKETADYILIDTIQKYVICPICNEKILLTEKDI